MQHPARPPNLPSQWKHQSCSSLLHPYLQTLIIPNTVQSASHWGRYEGEYKKDSKRKTPQTSPRFLPSTMFTPQPPKSSIEQFSKRSIVAPEKEKHKCVTLMTLLGHNSQETLEDID